MTSLYAPLSLFVTTLMGAMSTTFGISWLISNILSRSFLSRTFLIPSSSSTRPLTSAILASMIGQITERSDRPSMTSTMALISCIPKPRPDNR